MGIMTLKFIIFCLVLWNINFCSTVDYYGGPNIALNKVTEQHPGDYQGATSHNAVDGNTSNPDILTVCTHTDWSTSTTEAWWRVDLGDTYRLTGIKIFNRDRTSVRARLSGMVITGSISADGRGTELYRDSSNVADCTDKYTNPAYPVCQDIITIPVSMDDVRYVKISTTDYLTLCEVEVFAEVCSSPAVTHGQVFSQLKTIFKPGDVVNITCNVGYVPSSLDTTCQSDRSWAPVPSCRYVTCQVPLLYNGYYTRNGIEIYTSTTQPYGTTIQAHCSQPGYTPSPSTARTCQEDGQWSGSDPSCIPSITCNSLPSLTNGYYDVGSNNAPYYYDNEISPKCYEGYYLNGSNPTRRCISDNTWSGVDPTCLNIICSEPSTPNNGRYNGSQSAYDYGDILVLTCDKGYYVFHYKNIERKCVGKDNWSGYDLLCQRIICFQPGAISNGRYNKIQSNYYFESVIQPICDQGYSISNNVTQRVCEQYNYWSGEEPKCSVVTCNRPASILNGWLTPNQTTYNYNTTIVITCNDEYEIKEGTARRTCFEDGTWGPEPIDCVKIICNDTVNIRHASIKEYPVISIGEVGLVIYNSSFFHLQEGSTEVNCSADRKFSWTKSPCFVSVCPVPQIYRGQSNSINCITPDKCQVGTTLQISCDAGFILSSPATICLVDHTWSNAPACVEGPSEPQTQSVVIVAAVGWALFGGRLLLDLVLFVRKKIRSPNKRKSNGTSADINQTENNYTDLDERSRSSSNYTELQTRNDDYSSIEAAGHAYVNTQIHG